MRKFIKFLIGIGMLALIAGGIVLGISIKSKAYVKEELITKETIIEDDFANLNFDIDTANLTFLRTEDSKTKVVCVEKEKHYHEVSVKDNTLNIKAIDTHKWYENIFVFDFMFEEEKVTVYLPKATYENLVVKSSTSDVKVDNTFTFDKLNVSCSTGNVNITANVTDSVNVSCSTGSVSLSNMNLANDFSVKASTGKVLINNINCENLTVYVSTEEVSLINVLANKSFKVTSSTGSINAIDVDGEDMYFKSSTGSINLRVLTSKTFVASSSTGRVDVPSNTTGPDCVIKTSTGSIHASVK